MERTSKEFNDRMESLVGKMYWQHFPYKPGVTDQLEGMTDTQIIELATAPRARGGK